jgi:hypothetical protein
MYPWIVFTHVSALFVFLLAHGVSAGVAFRLRREQDPARIGALLEFSERALNVMFIALAVLVLSGVTAGFVGDWWGRGWIWAALLIILAIIVVMSLFGAHYYNRSRSALGLAYFGWMSYRDVAQRIGVPEGTAKSRVRLALAKLETLLDRRLLEPS